jgi:hypothetical protein
MARRLPKVLVFDLDGCTWWPEMYHLWGGGGSPFTPAANGNVKVEGAIKEFRGFKTTLSVDIILRKCRRKYI